MIKIILGNSYIKQNDQRTKKLQCIEANSFEDLNLKENLSGIMDGYEKPNVIQESNFACN